MPKKKTAEEFIADAIAVHGDRYDYSSTQYTLSTNKVAIICKLHGEFIQTAKDHIGKKAGCPECANVKNRENVRSNTEEFINKCLEVHGNKYDYSKVNYTHSKNPVVIICPIHGEFEQTPNVHLKGCHCPACASIAKSLASRKTQEDYIEDAIDIHGGVYNYDKTRYIKSNEKITVTCAIHGDFEIEANAHLQGCGCTKCSKSNKNVAITKGVGNGWSYSRWEELGKKSKYFDSYKLYIIECSDGAETFIKVGKTYRTVGMRYRNCHIPYEWKLVKEVVGSPRFISELEEELHRNLRKAGYTYTPIKQFDGMHECYKASYEELKI